MGNKRLYPLNLEETNLLQRSGLFSKSRSLAMLYMDGVLVHENIHQFANKQCLGSLVDVSQSKTKLNTAYQGIEPTQLSPHN